MRYTYFDYFTRGSFKSYNEFNEYHWCTVGKKAIELNPVKLQILLKSIDNDR